MNSLDNGRNNVYRDEMKYAERRQDVPLWHFYNANLALDELKQASNGGFFGSDGPDEAAFNHVHHRFEYAIAAAEGAGDIPMLLSARLVKAYVKPIVYADAINTDILRGAPARHASSNIGLGEAVDEAYVIAADALAIYDELKATPREEQSEKEDEDLARIVGFMGEITPILFFGGRHRTSKWFATPALAYDDRLAPNKASHIDIDFYDNRADRIKGHHLIQMKTSISEFSKEYDPEIAVLYAHDFGNEAHSTSWSSPREPFTSLRALLFEHEGVLPKEASSQLDKIASKAYKMLIAPRGARLMAAGMFGAYKGGKQLALLVAAMNKADSVGEAATAKQALNDFLSPNTVDSA